MKREIEAYFFLLQYNIVKSNHPPIPSHSRVSRRHRLLSPKSSHFLFNSSSPATVQKPVNFISHICAFSRGVLNVRSTRSHPTLAPRPQICLIGGNGFCAVAGEDELNRRRRFGDRSWCLLLTWEWLGAEGMIWPAIFWEQAENFCPLPQIPTTTI